MKRRCVMLFTVFAVCISAVTGGYHTVLAEDAQEETAEVSPEETEEAKAEDGVLEDGVYSAEFDTDSSMFHVNEANEGLGILTVKDGKMTLHVSLASKSIVNLFVGLAEDAQKDGAELLKPTTDTVTYSDGITEEVYGFDIPVQALDEEFDLALIGTKGKWYDHKVSVTDPKPEESAETGEAEFQEELNLEDGIYTIEVKDSKYRVIESGEEK